MNITETLDPITVDMMLLAFLEGNEPPFTVTDRPQDQTSSLDRKERVHRE